LLTPSACRRVFVIPDAATTPNGCARERLRQEIMLPANPAQFLPREFSVAGPPSSCSARCHRRAEGVRRPLRLLQAARWPARLLCRRRLRQGMPAALFMIAVEQPGPPPCPAVSGAASSSRSSTGPLAGRQPHAPVRHPCSSVSTTAAATPPVALPRRAPAAAAAPRDSRVEQVSIKPAMMLGHGPRPAARHRQLDHRWRRGTR